MILFKKYYFILKDYLSSVWLYSIFWSLLPLFGPQHQYVLEAFQTTCSFDFISQDKFSRIVVILLNIFGYFLPIILITFCLILAFIVGKKYQNYIEANSLENFEIELQQNLNLPSALKKTSTINNSIQQLSNENFGSQIRNNINSKVEQQSVKENENLKSIRIKIEWQITKNSIAIIFLFCILYLPYVVCTLIAQFSDNRQKTITPFTTMIITSLAKFSTVINPLIIIITHKKILENLRIP